MRTLLREGDRNLTYPFCLEPAGMTFRKLSYPPPRPTDRALTLSHSHKYMNDSRSQEHE